MISEGDSFGDYTVVCLLGKGGMGSVWLLRSPTGEEIAAKILDEESAADHDARKRFLREAELAMGVKHPNIVETYDVGEDPDTGICYILMEYMPGGTLADYIKAYGAMEIDDAVAVVRAMTSVLELARQNGIVHRDIKPANIMFDQDGVPKLADLGIARMSAGDTNTTTLTQTGAMIGTPAYMAPEQMLDAHHVDTRADIYSLGIVFYEMLTGERPNKDDTVVQILAKAVQGEPIPDVRTLRPEVSASLAQLLNMMVVPDKEGRISTPGQIVNAIDIIERTGKFDVNSADKSRRTNSKSSRGRRRRTWIKLRRIWKSLSWKYVLPIAVLYAMVAAVFAFAYIEASSGRKKTARASNGALAKNRPEAVASTNAPLRAAELVLTNAVEKTMAPVADSKPLGGEGRPEEVQPVPVQTDDVAPDVHEVVKERKDAQSESAMPAQPGHAADGEHVADAGVLEQTGPKQADAQGRKIADAGQGEPAVHNFGAFGNGNAPGKTLFSSGQLRGRTPTKSVQLALDALFPGWEVSKNNESDERSGYLESKSGERNVLVTLPPDRGVPLVLSRRVSVPKTGGVLHVCVSNHSPESQFRLRVCIGGWVAREMDVKDGWTDVYVNLFDWRRKTVNIDIEQVPTGWFDEWAYWSKIEFLEDAESVELAEAQKTGPKCEDFAIPVGSQARGELKDVVMSLYPLWHGYSQVKGFDTRHCYDEEYLGRYNVIRMQWAKKTAFAKLFGNAKTSLRMVHPILSITVAGDGENPFDLKVGARTEFFSARVVARQWETFDIDLVKAEVISGSYYQMVPLKNLYIEVSPAGGKTGCAYIADIKLEERR